MAKDDLNNAIIDLSKGNTQSLSVIYDSMARMIYSVAYASVGNSEDAEDVLQETMLAIIKYAHTYKNGSNAKAWILSIANHRAVDIIRKRKKEALYEVALSENHDNITEIETLEMLKILSDGERQVVVLRLYADMPYSEISKMTGTGIFTLQKRFQRAIKKLKKYNFGEDSE